MFVVKQKQVFLNDSDKQVVFVPKPNQMQHATEIQMFYVSAVLQKGILPTFIQASRLNSA